MRVFLKCVALCAIYVLTARLGLKLNAVYGFASLIWPPTGISLAALVLFGPALWPGIAAGAFLANLGVGASVWVALGIAVGNTLEALAGRALLERAGFRPSLSRLRDVFSLTLWAALGSTLISASVGVGTLYLAGTLSVEAAKQSWIVWWVGDVMGAILIAPVIFVWSERKSLKGMARLRVVEIFLLVSLVLLMSTTVFTGLLGIGTDSLLRPYLMFPVLTLITYQLDARWTATANFLTAMIAIGAIILGDGSYWSGSFSWRLLQAQVFLGVLSVGEMFLAATYAELRARAAEKRRAEGYQRFLKEATQLLSESLDYATTLRRLAHAAVPDFADWCFVQLMRDQEKVEAAELACSEPEIRPVLEELTERYLSDPDGPTVLASVVRSKQSRLVHGATDEHYRKTSKDARHLELLRKLNFHDLIACPLIVRGEVVGAIAVGLRRPDRFYGKDEVLVVEELARRAVIAMENARLYREAKEAVLARDEFLSIASHELRTPLTSLFLQLQIFNRGVRTSLAEPGREHAETVEVPRRLALAATSSEEQTRRLGALLDELLDLTRIRVGRLSLTFETFDLRAVVYEVVERFRIEMAQKKIAVTVRAPEPVVGRWDRVRADQIVTNLLSNAIKYGGGRPVQIAVEQDDTQPTARLTVTDQGIGIAAEMRARIFRRFERGGSDGLKISGLGLGLYIVQQIVKGHGGTIEVESEVGCGSVFTVRLPLAPSVQPALPGAMPPGQNPGLTPLYRNPAAPGADNSQGAG